jgi:hypothetical protein
MSLFKHPFFLQTPALASLENVGADTPPLPAELSRACFLELAKKIMKLEKELKEEKEKNKKGTGSEAAG